MFCAPFSGMSGLWTIGKHPAQSSTMARMSTMEATIFNVQKFSTEDGPGIRTTVFFKGCPLRCPWCHNPESQSFSPEVVWHGGRCLGDRGCLKVCPENALAVEDSRIIVNRRHCTGCGDCVAYCPASALEMHGQRLSVEALFDLAARDAAFYAASGGGVTLSGGEPLAQPAAAIALLRMLRETGIHTALDTCAAVPDPVLDAALAHTDLVLLDVKTTDPKRHLEYTGLPLDRVVRAVDRINAAGIPVWVRTPVIPGYTDDEANIRNVARFVAERLKHCERHDLLAYSNLCESKYAQLDRPFPLSGAPLLDPAVLAHLCTVAQEAGSRHVHWSGPVRVVEGLVS